MDSLEDYYLQIHNNHLVIKSFIISLAIYMLLAPFSGLLPLQGNLLIYFRQNINGFQGLPENVNPIFLTIEIIMYQFDLLFEYLFPLIFGVHNYFFIRFLLKLPLFLFFFIDAVIVKKIFQIEYKNNDISNFAFFIQLFNFPLIYSSFILGTSESIAIFLFLASYFFMIQVLKKEGTESEKKLHIFLSGFLLGLAITFSIWFIFVILLFLRSLKIKDVVLYVLSIIVSFLLVLLPYYFIFRSFSINYSPDVFGIGILLQFIGLNILIPALLIIEISLLILLSLFLKIEIIDRLILMATVIIIFSPYLTINEFIIFLEVVILGLMKYSKSEKIITFDGNRTITLPSPVVIILLMILYSIFFVYIIFIYPIFNVFYLNIIELSILGRTNIKFWQNNVISEFKSLSFIIFSMTLGFIVFIVQKKRKIFNTNKNYSSS